MKKNFGLKFILWVLTYIGAICFLIPFIILFITTFKEEKDIYDPFFVPDFFFLDNYKIIFKAHGFFSALANTVSICIVTLVLAILISSMAGYMISRMKKGIFKFTYVIMVMTLIIPAQTNMMMLYKIGVFLHIINTVPYLIILYISTNVAYSSMIYYAFTKSIPIQMEEAAFIDGCGRFGTFFRIIFPLLMPATGTVIVTEIFWYWNDFQNPLIYLTSGKTTTLMLLIYNFRDTIGATQFSTTQWGPVSTLCFVATIPILAFFLFTQKYLIKGLSIGGVKG